MFIIVYYYKSNFYKKYIKKKFILLPKNSSLKQILAAEHIKRAHKYQTTHQHTPGAGDTTQY